MSEIVVQSDVGPRMPSVFDWIPATGRRQRDGDVEDHQQADPLRRHGVEAQGRPQVCGVQPGASPPGCNHPRDDPQAHGDQRADQEHRQGVQKRLLDLVPDRTVGNHRCAEITVSEPFQVDHVLIPLGLVQAVLLHDRFAKLLGAVLAAQPGDRAAGQRSEQQEVDRERHENRDDREPRPLDDVVGVPHTLMTVMSGAGWCSSTCSTRSGRAQSPSSPWCWRSPGPR